MQLHDKMSNLELTAEHNRHATVLINGVWKGKKSELIARILKLGKGHTYESGGDPLGDVKPATTSGTSDAAPSDEKPAADTPEPETAKATVAHVPGEADKFKATTPRAKPAKREKVAKEPKKAKEPKAAKAPKAPRAKKEPKVREPGAIRSFCEELLLRARGVDEKTKRPLGLTYADILGKVQAKFPKAETTIGCLRWYQTKMNKRRGADKVAVPFRPKAKKAA